MVKQKNATPQELYRARKEKEEQERNALLPPGLQNHGNTCFMNSVLQGLIATPLLYELANPAQSSSQPRELDTSSLSIRRSPQLTNGHDLAGPYEKPWEEGMPLGDVFFNLMMKAWSAQRNQQKTTLSPREVLSAIGKKYDQYLDFAQQDAHEFLRQLLDSMRMEELDIIKKRQPPPPPDKKKHRRRPTLTQLPTEETLSTVADMIFGGKLTSILVCQKCKHVSQTYEDFNDLSLSIKPEDYVRERKRDRLKNLAKKLANLNASSPTVAPASTSTTSSTPPRSSSVPSSPGRTVVSLPPEDDSRPSVDTNQSSAMTDAASQSGKPLQPTSITLPDHDEKPEKRLKKDKHSDPWVKISRRISLTVGLSKNKDRVKRHPPPVPPPVDVPTRASIDTTGPEIRVVRPPSIERRHSSNPDGHHPNGRDPTPSPESGTPQRLAKQSHSHRTPKSSRPAKPSPAKMQYLRRVLADVPPSTPHPFAIFRPPNGISHHSGPTTAQNMWMKMTQLQSVEECLRLFTAVEVLDGENMVGCRRCWKMQNGVYVSPPSDLDVEDESESEEDVDLPPLPVLAPNGFLPSGAVTPALQEPPVLTSLSSPSLGVYSQHGLNANASTSSLPSSLAGSTELSGAAYRHQSTPPPVAIPRSPGLYGLNTPGGLPIPLIATIAPDSPVRSPTTARAEAFAILDSGRPAPPESNDQTPKSSAAVPKGLSRADDRDSLHAPTRITRRQTADIGTTTDDDSGGEESDASLTSAISSANTSTPSLASNSADSPPMLHASPNFDALATPRAPDSHLTRPPTNNQSRKRRPKPVLLCPAYKRYLIAVPPPVLVIHLKRFQQLSKTPVMSFSHGFKKLDDYISFPEYLDLTPFLAPKKEDFGLGKHANAIGLPASGRDPKKCVYRLYAVVVHIGNMLGGHYVAYTALPPKPQADDSISEKDSAKSSTSEKSSEKPSVTPPRQWAYISDHTVRLATLEDVLKSKAYLCMYERS